MALLELSPRLIEPEPYIPTPEKLEVSRFLDPYDIVREIMQFYPGLKPLFLELSACNSLQHGLTTATVYRNAISSFDLHGLISPQSYLRLNSYTPGAALHDVGKLGIVQGDIVSSIKTINEHPQVLLTNSQEDLRSPSQIARQQLHSAVGGYALLKMGIPLFLGQPPLLPQWVAVHNAQIPFRHHEAVLKDDFTDKTSYPRQENGNGDKHNLEHREKINYKDDLNRELAAFLVELADCAVSMREDRPYRVALPETTIRKQLEILLTEKTIRHFLPLFRTGNKAEKIKEGSIYSEIRNTLTENIILNTYQIDSLIRTPLNIAHLFGPDSQKGETKSLDVLNTHEDTPLLVEIFGHVWSENRHRLERDQIRFYQKKHIHEFRKLNH